MTLKITIKPGETFFVGKAEIDIRCESITTVVVEGDAPVLRQEDYIPQSKAISTPARLHYIVQQMYLTGDIKAHHVEYFALAQALISETPSAANTIAEANQFLIEGAVYKAVKLLKRLNISPLRSPPARLRLVAGA